ncbi:MAG: phosphotransferase [Woeseia sp.]|nr:phosphotransferase [Woeseia sp.]MBT8096895.1 phosphotransferase [Woeseia sp.]NNE62202.1 phosphotransferase [Woeseia sp.]NNL55292.1 phosphotransferase [Woeseia sp.]
MTATPLTVIESPPPQFTATEACDVARQHFGLDVRATQLVSERDQNFLLQVADEPSWVLKIANAAEDPLFTVFQIRALKHIASRAAPLPVPVIRPTTNGANHVELEKNGQTHIARVVSWLPGTPLAEKKLVPKLCRNLGAFLASLGESLHDFAEAGGEQTLLWDMRQAPALRDVLPLVADPEMRELVASCLDDFATRALPQFDALRCQVIHNDFNPDNILLDASRPNEIMGVIDFGDLQSAPLIVDIAIGAAYLRNADGDPLQHIAEFVSGYHAVTPLAVAEINLLYDLISTRLATTVVILDWRRGARKADDSYLDKAAASEATAAPFLRRLRELPRADVGRRLRQVCASVDATAE